MDFIAFDDHLIFSLFLFGVSFCGISALSYAYKRQERDRTSPKFDKYYNIPPKGKFYRLACLLEDAPGSAFKGQACQLATPLMSPLTCLIEDAPETSLLGQVYELAIPLLSPIACLIEDIPEIFLTGQCCQWATPLMSSFACLFEDVPTTFLRGQAYEYITPFACIATQTWHEFYRQHLGKPNINYWEWRDKPEAHHVCRELSLLLRLPAPQKSAQQVLESLAQGKDPFLRPSLATQKNGNNLASFSDSMDVGKFAHLEWRVQTAMRRDFKQWHEVASLLIGIEALGAVYRVCYKTSWDMIQSILSERPFLEDFIIDESAPWWKVLGVSPSANTLQVEKAYKKLMRSWHPDLNKHPYATKVTSCINIAYEHYQSLHQISFVVDKTSIKNNANFLHKIREWLKPLFSR